MIGSQPPFHVGQKVRPSRYGVSRNIFPGAKATRNGTVTKVDEFNSPTVLWDGRKTTSGYHPDFVEAVPKSPNKRKR